MRNQCNDTLTDHFFFAIRKTNELTALQRKSTCSTIKARCEDLKMELIEFADRTSAPTPQKAGSAKVREQQYRDLVAKQVTSLEVQKQQLVQKYAALTS